MKREWQKGNVARRSAFNLSPKLQQDALFVTRQCHTAATPGTFSNIQEPHTLRVLKTEQRQEDAQTPAVRQTTLQESFQRGEADPRTGTTLISSHLRQGSGDGRVSARSIHECHNNNLILKADTRYR